ncbi:hypothetical protein Tco_0059675 [Tanacetum coccineum]
MEEDYEPTVQHQRRVNPKIHDVIKKEVEKLLDAGLIYRISDSPWVSPVHCVPKKGGMTVVTNDENELVPTRLEMNSIITSTVSRVISKFQLIQKTKKRPHSPAHTEHLLTAACLLAYATGTGPKTSSEIKSSEGVYLAKKLLKSSKLVMKDPSEAIIVPTSPLEKYLMPGYFGLPFIKMPIQ